MRNFLPPIICGVCGVIMMLHFFLPESTTLYKTMMDWVTNSTIVVGVFALFIGLASLVHNHGNRIARRSPGWGYSVITLFFTAIVALTGIISQNVGPTVLSKPLDKYNYVADGEKSIRQEQAIYHTLFGYKDDTYKTNVADVAAFRSKSAPPPEIKAQEITVRKVPLFMFFYNYVIMPMSATTFSLLAFYMITATYRAMRAKSWEASLLLISSIIILIGQVPIEEIPFVGRWILGNAQLLVYMSIILYMLYAAMKHYFMRNFVTCGCLVLASAVIGVIWHLTPATLDFEGMKSIILDYPNNAAKRAILIGVQLGSLATSIKILSGIEKPYMGGRG